MGEVGRRAVWLTGRMQSTGAVSHPADAAQLQFHFIGGDTWETPVLGGGLSMLIFRIRLLPGTLLSVGLKVFQRTSPLYSSW